MTRSREDWRLRVGRFGLWAGLVWGGLACGQQLPQEAFEIQGEAKPAAVVEASQARQREGASRLASRTETDPALPAKQILFGDLHVHTSAPPWQRVR